MILKVSAATDCGGQNENQDRVLLNDRILDNGHIKIRCNTDELQLFAVADGVTHCADGQYASQTALKELTAKREQLVEIFDKFEGNLDDNELQRHNLLDSKEFGILLNRDFLKKVESEGKNGIYASTLSMIAVKGELMMSMCIGDSPMLLYRDENIYVLNDSHLTPSGKPNINGEGFLTTDSSVLSSYIGNKALTNNVYCTLTRLQKGDMILIFSDGITNALSIQTIINCIKKHYGKSSKLVKAVNNTHAEYIDNLSAIIVN